jgi:hypothetical protein
LTNDELRNTFTYIGSGVQGSTFRVEKAADSSYQGDRVFIKSSISIVNIQYFRGFK